MATISTRAKSPLRSDAILKALQRGPIYDTGVLLGNWVEDRIECPKRGTLYFPPKEEINYEQLKPESRQPDFRLNKLNSLQKSTIGNAELPIKTIIEFCDGQLFRKKSSFVFLRISKAAYI